MDVVSLLLDHLSSSFKHRMRNATAQKKYICTIDRTQTPMCDADEMCITEGFLRGTRDLP